MFNFFKKFFKEKEPEIKTLELGDLKSFFNEESKEVTKELNQKIKEIKEKIDSEITKTKENLATLKKAELRNPNIPIRARQFMDGNRASYIKMVNNLLDYITIGNDYDSIIEFCEDFNDRLTQFAKSTTKSYQVLQEFLANESRELALNIKHLDFLVKRLKELIKEGDIDKLRQLKEGILAIDKKKEQKVDLEKELREKEAQKEEKTKLKENLEKLQKELKESNEYAQFLSLSELNKKSLNELVNLKSKIIHSFAVINAALKKYSRITIKNAALLDDYLQEPVSALIGDGELKILELFDGTRKNILNNSIELKDKKKDKILEEINRLNKEFFADFQNKYKEIEEKIKGLEEKIKENNSKAKLEEFNERLDKAKHYLEKLESYISYLKKEIEKIDFAQIKRKLEEKIKDVFGVGVKLN